jgi:lipopolysaccharide export system ATP-binding protein
MDGIGQLCFDSICYHSSRAQILRGVYIEVNPGTICGLFGRNGSGKSTLLKIGVGECRPTAGTIFIDGRAFLLPKKRQRHQKIAYLSQETFLPYDMPVEKLFKAFPAQAQRVACDTPLAARFHQAIGALSSGECRLLEIILLIALNRPYLFLDEPFSGIEPTLVEYICDLLRTQREQGKGILLSDHYYQYVTSLLDTAYFLERGHCEPLQVDSGLEMALRRKGYVMKAPRRSTL